MIGLASFIEDDAEPDQQDLRASGGCTVPAGDAAEDDSDGVCAHFTDGPIPPLIIDGSLDDFETPGVKDNPLFAPSPAVAPSTRFCGRCGASFLSTPIIWVDNVRGYPLFCTPCDLSKKFLRPQVAYPWALTFIPDSSLEIIPLHTHMGCARVYDFDLEMDSTILPFDLHSTGPKGHATHGPSSLKHKEICPYWTNTGGTNSAAERGTLMHAALEEGEGGPSWQQLTEDEREIVGMVALLFNEEIAELGLDATIEVEREMNVAKITWGTADLVGTSKDGKRAKVLDAKFGWIEVDDAKDNLQGWCYALAKFFEDHRVEEVEVIFAQPRCDMVSRHTFSRRGDFAAMYDRIYSVVKNAHVARGSKPDEGYDAVVLTGAEEKPAHNAVPSNCQYCALKDTCPATRALALRVAGQIDDKFVIPPHLDPANTDDPETIAYMRQVADFLEPWIEAVRKRSTRMVAEDGIDLPGYTLVQQNLPRSINDPVKAWEVFQSQGGTIEEFLGAVGRVGLGELESAVAGRAPRGAKQQAKQALEDALVEAEALRREEGVKVFLKRKRMTKDQILGLTQ